MALTLPRTRFGRTGLIVTRLALGGFPFGGVNLARDWNPFTPEGQNTAISTIHYALEQGINIVDTAPGYGNGNSEIIFGKALKGKREHVILATKVGYEGLQYDVELSVEQSLRRLQTDWIDIIQFHGGMYTVEQIKHILEDGLYSTLVTMKERGKVRYIGFTVEEPWTAKPLIDSGLFDVMQVRYNVIYQSAALHVLSQAQQMNMGVSVMRPMTSGIMQRMASYIAPEWHKAHDLYDAALRFVLSDSRVHVVNVGMRWPSEVASNVELAVNFVPEFDMAELPRMTAHIYAAEDQELNK
jgi:aryl-alcohol dehydrogenase-like predicted oxidoreductase